MPSTREWFGVRHLKEQLGGWDELLNAAIAGEVPGAASCVVGIREHVLVSMRRHWPAHPIRFTAVCSCAATVNGEPGQAFITVVRAFETGHVGERRSTRRGVNRSPPR